VTLVNVRTTSLNQSIKANHQRHITYLIQQINQNKVPNVKFAAEEKESTSTYIQSLKQIVRLKIKDNGIAQFHNVGEEIHNATNIKCEIIK
jgi:hypothetical protein